MQQIKEWNNNTKFFCTILKEIGIQLYLSVTNQSEWVNHQMREKKKVLDKFLYEPYKIERCYNQNYDILFR